MAERELAGRVAIVTGAGRNIGRAIAIALAEAGAAVIVNAKSNQQETEAVAAAVRDVGSEALVTLGDVRDPAAARNIVAAGVGRFGRLDILVNNAAIRREVPFDQIDHAAWREVLDVCLDGAFHCVQASLAALRQSDSGAIINIGGLTASTGAQHRAHVVTAKAGLIGLTRALAHELASDGITVNCVSPGLIATNRVQSNAAPPHHHSRSATLVGRRGEPDEVAAAVRWLAGPSTRFVTGQTIHVNGGAYLGG